MHEAVTLFRREFYDEVRAHVPRHCKITLSTLCNSLGLRYYAGAMPASDWPHASGSAFLLGAQVAYVCLRTRFESICKVWAFLSSTTLSTRATCLSTMHFSPWVLSSHRTTCSPLPSSRTCSESAALTALTATSLSLVRWLTGRKQRNTPPCKPAR
jgi:hypothetical protein